MSALTVKHLKENNEDFEWYPTTTEMLECVKVDILKLAKTELSLGIGAGRKYKDDMLYFKDAWSPEYKDNLYLGDVIDIGAGDGRALAHFTSDYGNIEVHAKPYAIEKATLHANNLIRQNVKLIGRDFSDISLVDKKFGVTFCNPPYSEFKEWTKKILSEVNSKSIYLIIPERWKNDDELKYQIEDKGEFEVIGSYDFLDADRKARAKIDIIRIDCRVTSNSQDTFNDWIAKNIGTFDKYEEVEFEDNIDLSETNIEEHNDKIAEVLTKSCNDARYKMIQNYKQLSSIDFAVIEQLGISRKQVLEKIKDDIRSLKNKYWRKMFDHTDSITKRLTSKMRNKILSEVIWFSELDFTISNIYSVVIWAIENSNKYTKEQAIEVYDKMMSFDNVTAYKSNTKWTDGGWRYNNKQIPEKWSLNLDYRIVVENGVTTDYNSRVTSSIYSDLATVADTMGFKNKGCYGVDTGEKGFCFADVETDPMVLEYKRFKNGNVHLKINQDFLMMLNVEIGKLKGWIMKPKDVQDEWNVTEEEAVKLFGKSITLLTDTNIKLLGV